MNAKQALQAVQAKQRFETDEDIRKAAEVAKAGVEAKGIQTGEYSPGTLIIIRDTQGNEISRETVPFKPEEETYQPEAITVDGRGPVQALRDRKGNFIDASTRRPIQGQIGVYERPRESDSPSGPRPLTQTAEARLIDQQANKWITATKPAVELDRQVKLLDTGLAAARRGDMASGAQTILVTFQKILDPPSVVRESEYMRSAAGQSLLNRVKGWIEQLRKGGAGIALPELEKFGNLAKEAARAQATGYLDSEKKRIGLVLDRYQIPHELVFQDFDFSPAAPTATTIKFRASDGRVLEVDASKWPEVQRRDPGAREVR